MSGNLLAQPDKEIVLRKEIDSIVNKIEAAKGETKNFRGLNGSYAYKNIDSVLVKIIHKYDAGLRKVTESFYMNEKSQLIFSTEEEITYYGDDSIGWAGKYYFQIGKLRYYETLGHGKSETEEWNPEKEVLSAYNKSLNQIKKYLSRSKE